MGIAVKRIRFDEPSPALTVHNALRFSPTARCPGAFVATPPGWLQDALVTCGGSTTVPAASGPEIAPFSSAFSTEIRRPGSGSCFLSNIEVTEDKVELPESPPSPIDSHPASAKLNIAM